MTQQEQEAIEAYAKEIMKSGCVSNERDFVDGMLKGAKFALSELRKPSESRPQIVDFFDKDCTISDVQAELSKSHKLYNYTQALDSYIDQLEFKSSKNIGRTDEELIHSIASLIKADLMSSYAPNFYEEGTSDGLPLVDLLSSTDSIDSGMENISLLVDGMDCIEEIAKLLPSIPTYYPYDIEMFQELFSYMYDNHHVTLLKSEMDEIMRICLKVVGGKVAPENQENDVNEDKDYQKSKANILIKAGYIAGKNDVNVELLEALKKIKTMCDGDRTSENSIWYICNRAITNYEKQMKS